MILMLTGNYVLARRADVDVKGEVTAVPGLVGTKHDVYVLNDQVFGVRQD